MSEHAEMYIVWASSKGGSSEEVRLVDIAEIQPDMQSTYPPAQRTPEQNLMAYYSDQLKAGEELVFERHKPTVLLNTHAYHVEASRQAHEERVAARVAKNAHILQEIAALIPIPVLQVRPHSKIREVILYSGEDPEGEAVRFVILQGRGAVYAVYNTKMFTWKVTDLDGSTICISEHEKLVDYMDKQVYDALPYEEQEKLMDEDLLLADELIDEEHEQLIDEVNGEA